MGRIGIQEVAQRAGVSTATVSYIINNKKQVSPETRKRVEQSIKELGYRPNEIARSFKTGKKNLVAFIVPDIADRGDRVCPGFRELQADDPEYQGDQAEGAR